MFEPKPKEDEPMDTGEIPCEDNYEEEGEIQSDDGEVFWAQSKTAGNKFLVDPTSYGLPPSSILELKKLSRARRFGIPIEHGRTALVDTGLMTHLYKSLGIDEDNEKHYRFNAVHMRGTQNMSTGDVHEYFMSFKPTYVEWINDISCNVIWTDHFSASKALLNLSKEIKNLDKIRFNANPFKKELESNTKEVVLNTNADAVDAREIEGAIPPGYWRLGVPSKKSRTILLRFATRSDKKQKFAEKNSEYYRKYGNPHFGNIPGIVSNSLRSEVLRQYRQRLHNYGQYLQDKNKKNPWGYLAEEWARQDKDMDARSKIQWTREGPPVKTDLRFSLIKKPVDFQRKQIGSDFGSSKSDNDKGRGKFPKMKMYADEEGKLQITTFKAVRIPRENAPYVEDLRQRINWSRKRKQLIQEELKNKRLKLWNESSDVKDSDYKKEEDDIRDSDDDGGCVETGTTMETVKEIDEEVDYDNDSDNENEVGEAAAVDIDVDDDDGDDDEGKGSSWALENYSDLKDTLAQGKNYMKTSDAKKPEKSKSDAENKDGDGDHDDDYDEDIYDMDVNHRSPLQIEFENDDYFEKESD